MKHLKKRLDREITVREALQSCTTHGLPYIVKTDLHLTERIFWAFSFVCCFIMIFVLLAPLFTRFKKAPTVVSVEMDYYNWNVSFPAITVCPVHQIDGDALETLITEYENKTGMDVRAHLLSISVVSLHNPVIPFMELRNKNNVLSVIKPEDYALIAARLFTGVSNLSVVTKNNWQTTVNTVMTEIGMCHVINSNVAIFDDPRKWRDSDVKYATNNIELTIHDGDFYTQLINHGEEYKVYVHSPDEIIHSSTASYAHETRGFLSLGIRVWSTRISEVLRQRSLEFRKCRLINEPISERYPVYSYNHCMLECRIKMIKRLCGCIPHFYRPIKNETLCTLLELQCVSHYKNEILSLSSNPVTLRKHKSSNEHFNPSETCGCQNACETDVYQIEDEDFVSQAETKLRVAISSFPKVRVVKDVIFGFYDIILRSGGVVNLCIGSSIISIMELIFLGIKVTFRPIIQHLYQSFN